SFASLVEASEAVSAIIAAGIIPAALEMLDDAMIGAVNAAVGKVYPDGAGAVLLIELDGPRAEVEAQAERVAAICRERQALMVTVARDETERALLWKGRKEAAGAVGRITAAYLLQHAEADLNFMFRLRRVFDPAGLMNPAKLLPSHPACGEGFRPARPTLPAGTWV